MKNSTIAKNSLTPWYKHANFLVPLVLMVFAFILYANTIPNGYNMDDELATPEYGNLSPNNKANMTKAGFDSIPHLFKGKYYEDDLGRSYEYRPMVHVSFAIEHQFFDPDPSTSHTINILLYMLTALVLYFTIITVFGKEATVLAGLTTLLFIAHPLHTEVVASIKNRDEILCLLGGLGGLSFAKRFVDEKWNLNAILFYVLFVGLFIFGILSKRTGLVFAIMIPMTLLWLKPISWVKLLLVVLPLAITVKLFSPSDTEQSKLLNALAFAAVPIISRWLIYLDYSSLKQAMGGIKIPSIKGMIGNYHLNDEGWGKPDVSKFSPQLIITTVLSLGMLCLIAGAGYYFYELRLFVTTLGCVLLLFLLAFHFPAPLKSIYILSGFMLVAAISITFSKTELMALLIFVLWAMAFFKPKLFGFKILLALLPISLWYGLDKGFVPMLSINAGTAIVAFMLSKPKLVKFAGLLVALPLAVWVVLNKGLDAKLITVALIVSGLVAVLSFEKVRKYALVGLTMVLPVIFAADIYLNEREYFVIETQSDFYVDYGYTPDSLDIEKALLNAEPLPPADTIGVIPRAGRELFEVENPLVGTHTYAQETATGFSIMGAYIKLLIFPHPLSFYYGYDQVPLKSWKDYKPNFSKTGSIPILTLAVLLAAIGFIVYYSQNVAYKPVTLALIFLLVGLLSVSNLSFLVAGTVAERLIYIGSLGFCLALAWLLLHLFKIKQFKDIKAKPVLLLLVGLLIGLYSFKTVSRNAVWKDRMTLFGNDAEHLLYSAKANQLYGFYSNKAAIDLMAQHTRYDQFGQLDEALHQQLDLGKVAKHRATAEKHFLRAINVDPQFHDALYNLGRMYVDMASYDKAIVYLERALKLQKRPDTYFELARSYDEIGDFTQAATNYQQCLARNPKNFGAYMNLGFIFFRTNQYDEVLDLCNKALSYFPNSYEARMNIGRVYLAKNDPKEAYKYFEDAFRYNQYDLELIQILIALGQDIGEPQKAEFYQQHLQKLKSGQL